MRRPEARELLMQMLFSMEAQKDFSEKAKDSFKADYMGESAQLPYFEGVYSAFIQNKDAIDEKIESTSGSWHTNRMAKVDLAVLRLCITEMRYLNDESVPESSAINEAVELAKKFGGEDSYRFINGILGKISREHEQQ